MIIEQNIEELLCDPSSCGPKVETIFNLFPLLLNPKLYNSHTL